MTAKIWLITTGMYECKALAPSMTNLLGGDVAAAGGPYPSYPTARLGAYPPADAEGPARPIPEKLIEAALEVLDGRPRNHFAFIIDDVELENNNQQAVIVEHMKEAARRV